MNKISFALVVLCAIDGGLFKHLPDYIPVCKRDQATINDCARKSVDALRPQLMNGIPELEVPGIEPLIIREVISVNSESSPIKATAKDLKVTGASNFTIKNLAVDLDTFTVRARVRIPRLHFEGRYKLDAQLLTVPLKGEGKLVADAMKCDAEFTMHSQLVERDGLEYLKFIDIAANINVKDYRLRLDGLFNGDKALGDAANEAINQNRAEFLRSTKPHLERTVSKIVLDFANRVVDDLPLDDLFPKP